MLFTNNSISFQCRYIYIYLRRKTVIFTLSNFTFAEEEITASFTTADRVGDEGTMGERQGLSRCAEDGRSRGEGGATGPVVAMIVSLGAERRLEDGLGVEEVREWGR